MSIYGCYFCFFFSSRRRHTRYWRDWSLDVCSSDLRADISQTRPARSRPLPQENGRREAGLWAPNKKAGVKPAFVVSIRSAASIPGGSSSTPTKPVVHADLGSVLVVAETPAGDIGRPCREGGVAEIVILVLGLGRPVRGEHVFETAANRIAVLVAAIGGEGRWHAGHRHPEIVAVAPGVTALGVEQRRTPGVAEPAGDRAELVGVRGHEGAARKQHAVIIGV